MPQAENIQYADDRGMPLANNVENTSNPWVTSEGQVENMELTKRRVENSQRKIGAKLLSSANFEKRHQDIVDSSFVRAEHLPAGSGAERRNFAYVSRLEDLVSKHGNRLEQRLWQASARNLIVKPENIVDTYWRSQEELIRDRTGERVTIEQNNKANLIHEIQSKQMESLKSWSDYLGNEDSNYPMWFKIYAWDGMSKMSSIFDTEKRQFKKRNVHTVSPYPKLNPAALAKVYDAVTDFYDIDGAQAESNARNAHDLQLNSLVASGNFPKLYARMLLDTKVTVKTPERTQDVSGEWIEYLPGDEERLAEAAEGTPWCIVSPSVGRSYLTTGEYFHQIDEDNGSDTESHAKFILFHLHDPVTGQLSSSACASIRLGPDGQVAEISGLADGPTQRIEDVLLPTVEEKVKTLPGGERYLQAFADTKYLTKLTHKFEDGEPFNAEDLAFIFETDGLITTLNTYGNDPRISELRKDVDRLLENGTDANLLMEVMRPYTIVDHLDVLLKHGANIDTNELVHALDAEDVAGHLETLIAHGADIDVNELVQDLYPDAVADNLETLIAHGADIDVNELVQSLNLDSIARHLETLITHGVNIDANKLAHALDAAGVGVSIYCESLLTCGADAAQLAHMMHAGDRLRHFDTLIAHGADIDINRLAEQIDDNILNLELGKFLDHDMNVDDGMLLRLRPLAISDNLDKLLAHGANARTLTLLMTSSDIAKNVDSLLDHGANPEEIYVILRKTGSKEWDKLSREQQERVQEAMGTPSWRKYFPSGGEGLDGDDGVKLR